MASPSFTPLMQLPNLTTSLRTHTCAQELISSYLGDYTPTLTHAAAKSDHCCSAPDSSHEPLLLEHMSVEWVSFLNACHSLADMVQFRLPWTQNSEYESE